MSVGIGQYRPDRDSRCRSHPACRPADGSGPDSTLVRQRAGRKGRRRPRDARCDSTRADKAVAAAMRGTIRIVPCEPAHGQRITAYREHSVMAVRHEFRGDLGLEGRDSVTATRNRSCSIRSAVSVRPQPRWLVRDVEDDLEFAVQSGVREKPERITPRYLSQRATDGLALIAAPDAGGQPASGNGLAVVRMSQRIRHPFSSCMNPPRP